VKQGFQKVKQGFQTAGKKIKQGFQRVGNKVKQGFQKVKQGLKTAGKKMKEGFQKAGKWIKENSPTAVKFGLNILSTAQSVGARVVVFALPGIGKPIPPPFKQLLRASVCCPIRFPLN
jgi:hypothetical protein